MQPQFRSQAILVIPRVTEESLREFLTAFEMKGVFQISLPLRSIEITEFTIENDETCTPLQH